MKLLYPVLIALGLSHAGTAAAAICDDSSAATTDSCLAGKGCEHLGTTAGTDTVLQGNTSGGTLYPDACPAGQVMVGVSGTIGSSWDQIQVVCGVPTMTDALGIAISAGATLPLRGTNVTTSASAMCPADQMVVGFDGRAGGLMDQIALRCAPATAAFSPGTYTVTLGTATNQAPVGGSGGTPFPTTDCPAGQLAIGANIRAGGSNDAFGLICGAYSATDGLDADCDGIADGVDSCPNAPGNGCPMIEVQDEGRVTLSSGAGVEFLSPPGGTALRDFQITNVGLGVLTLGAPSLSGTGSMDFTATLDAESATPVQPAILSVTFKPLALSSGDATLSFTHDGVGAPSPFVLKLQGRLSPRGGGSSGGGGGGGCSAAPQPATMLLAFAASMMLWRRRRARHS